MTIRNLDAIFRPRSIAFIGATERPRSIGAVIARNLIDSGFEGACLFVNPTRQTVFGAPCFASVEDLPSTPDLAVIATPPKVIPDIVARLGRRGTKGVAIITAGFGEGASGDGRELRQALLNAAQPHLLRIVGPNTLGIMVPSIKLNASFAHMSAMPGRLAFVSQSGAVMAGIVDWAAAREIGFSHLVSIGDMADVDFGDMLDYLALERGVSAILLYMEGVSNARKFMTAARAASRLKPVVVMKAGRHAAGARAAASHTGSLAGADEAFAAAFRRAGLLRVRDLQQLFDAVEILAAAPRLDGERLAIITNGGGFGVLATDALVDEGGRLAELGAATIERLNRVLPPTWSGANPIDIIGDADGERYTAAIEAALDDPAVDALVVMNCPTAVASSLEVAEAVCRALAPKPRKPVVAAWIGDSEAAHKARARLVEGDLPVYETPAQAISGFMHVVRHRKAQESLMETPPSAPEAFTPDREAALAIIDKALDEGRALLSEPEAKALLAAYRIPVAEARTAPDPETAASVAAEIGFPVAVKILSPDITHKSDVGGVRLDLETTDDVRQAAEAVIANARTANAEARIDGVTVQAMVRRPGAHELIAGLTVDRQFGPIVLFGQGGVAVEVVADKAVALVPLNMGLARELMASTRVWRLLQGYRDRPAADLDRIALTLIKVAQIAIDLAAVVELDINPLLADADGVVALDARVALAPAAGAPEHRLAIRPYPSDLRWEVNLPDGRSLLLRAIRPEDEPSLIVAFRALSPTAVRLRFFGPLKNLDHRMAARLTQIDYDREMAFVLADKAQPGKAEIYGVVRLAADPDNTRGEYAIVLRDDMTGQGLGQMMMRRMIDYARDRGLGEVFGHVLKENEAMLAVNRKMGFTREADHDDPGVYVVRLAL